MSITNEIPRSLKVADATRTGSARSVIARYFRMWNDGDASALHKLIALGWVDHAHPDWRTTADVSNAVVSAHVENPERRVLVDAMLGDGRLITVNGRIATRDRVQNRVWIVRVEDDQMHEMWTYSAD